MSILARTPLGGLVNGWQNQCSRASSASDGDCLSAWASAGRGSVRYHLSCPRRRALGAFCLLVNCGRCFERTVRSNLRIRGLACAARHHARKTNWTLARWRNGRCHNSFCRELVVTSRQSRRANHLGDRLGIVAVAFALIGGWLGGELVYR